MFVHSGRERKVLGNWFADLNIGLSAAGGHFLRYPEGSYLSFSYSLLRFFFFLNFTRTEVYAENEWRDLVPDLDVSW